MVTPGNPSISENESHGLLRNTFVSIAFQIMAICNKNCEIHRVETIDGIDGICFDTFCFFGVRW